MAQDGVVNDTNTLPDTQRLQLAEQACEIYRQQLKYMQDHLASLRSLIQDKENIIENLTLRYDLGIIVQDPNHEQGSVMLKSAVVHYEDTFTSHVVFGYLRGMDNEKYIPTEIQSLCLSFYGKLEIDYGPAFNQKSAALAQRTILENFELRSTVEELRSEIFHIRSSSSENVEEIKLLKEALATKDGKGDDDIEIID